MARSFLFLIIFSPFAFSRRKRKRTGENPMRKKGPYVGITRIRFKGPDLDWSHLSRENPAPLCEIVH
jgi:hypothetical protein